MKRILHVISSLNAGGMETMIMNYYRNIDRSKYQFDFMINDFSPVFYENEIVKLGGKIYRVHAQHPHLLRNRIEVTNVIKNNNFDAIHVHQGITYFYPLKCAKKYGIKNRIVHNHGINRKFLKYLSLYNNLYARNKISSYGNNFIACSTDVLDHIFSKRIIQNKNYKILPNAIDVEKYIFNVKHRESVRAEFDLKNEIVFVHVGTFTHPKNHIFLLNVFKDFLIKNKTAVLILVGDGELKEEIKQFVEVNKMTKNVIFAGIRFDVERILSAADVMLFPSIYEGLPLTLIEAQANGINIIASQSISRECKITNLIKFLSIKDKSIWVNEMNRLFENNLYKNRKNYNSKVMNTDFSIKNSARKLENIYDSL